MHRPLRVLVTAAALATVTASTCLTAPVNGVVPPFTGQPVQGFSALIEDGRRGYLALSDNGYGAKANSADFLLRAHRLQVDFTTGTVHPDFNAEDVHANIATGLASPLVALFYLLAMAAIGAHFYHGLWSSVRSLGLAPPATNPFRRRLAAGFAVIVWLGFTAIPLAALIGKLL